MFPLKAYDVIKEDDAAFTPLVKNGIHVAPMTVITTCVQKPIVITGTSLPVDNTIVVQENCLFRLGK